MRNFATFKMEGLISKSLESSDGQPNFPPEGIRDELSDMILRALDGEDVFKDCGEYALLSGLLVEVVKQSKEDDSPEVKACVSRKIPILMDEGYPQKQAIAIAFSMCRKNPSMTKGREVAEPSGERMTDEKLRVMGRERLKNMEGPEIPSISNPRGAIPTMPQDQGLAGAFLPRYTRSIASPGREVRDIERADAISKRAPYPYEEAKHERDEKGQYKPKGGAGEVDPEAETEHGAAGVSTAEESGEDPIESRYAELAEKFPTEEEEKKRAKEWEEQKKKQEEAEAKGQQERGEREKKAYEEQQKADEERIAGQQAELARRKQEKEERAAKRRALRESGGQKVEPEASEEGEKKGEPEAKGEGKKKGAGKEPGWEDLPEDIKGELAELEPKRREKFARQAHRILEEMAGPKAKPEEEATPEMEVTPEMATPEMPDLSAADEKVVQEAAAKKGQAAWQKYREGGKGAGKEEKKPEPIDWDKLFGDLAEDIKAGKVKKPELAAKALAAKMDEIRKQRLAAFSK